MSERTDPAAGGLGALLALLLAAFAGSAVAQYNIGTGSAMDLYQGSCAGCHGATLGGGSAGSLVDDEWVVGKDDEAISRAIRDGVEGTAMPAWGSSLDAGQIRALVILLREQRDADRLKALEKSNTVQPGTVFRSERHAFTLERVAEMSGTLWAMDFLPDGSLLATQREGTLWHIVEGQRTAISGTPEVLTKSQGGLLDVKVHARGDGAPWVYLSFSEKSAQGAMTAVVRGRIREGRWVDQQDIFRVPVDLHVNTAYHYGSRLAIAGDYVYVSVGDRGRKEMAQALDRPNGKIHRLHLDGRVPRDNPFRAPGQFASTWSYGHRNPQGLEAHPATGEIWASEHGPRGGDEVNRIRRGRNYGWPLVSYGMDYDGTAISASPRMRGVEEPARYWTPSISPGGIAFYTGDAFPAWKGSLFVGGQGARELHRLSLRGHVVTADETVMSGQGRVRDVANGPDGHPYVILNNPEPASSGIYRLIPAPDGASNPKRDP